MATRIQDMTTKERLHKLVDELTEQEAAATLEYVASRREGGVKDEWGDLSKLHDIAFGETMRRLAEEERTAGHEPW